jgi:uncharacterized protein DUF6953
MADGISASDVAAYMKQRLDLDTEKTLYQEDVVDEIERKFGKKFIYENENGNLAIARAVLVEFRQITPHAVWVRSERCWRRREKHDDPKSRMQE